MAYNQQNDGGYARVNEPLPGAGAHHTEDARETAHHLGHPHHHGGLLAHAGLGNTGLGHSHNPHPGMTTTHPDQHFGGGGKPINYDTANVGIAPIGTGLVHDLTSPDVAVRHHATDALASGNALHTTSVGTDYNTTGNNAAYNAGAQPMQGTHQGGVYAGMAETVKETVTGGHQTGTGNAYGAHTGTPITSAGYRTDDALTAPFVGGVQDQTNLVHQGALQNDAPFIAGAQPMHSPQQGGMAGMVQSVKNAVAGHNTITNDSTVPAYGAHTGHGHPMTASGYRTEPVNTGVATGTAYTTNADQHDTAHKKTGIMGLVDKVTGKHHDEHHALANDGHTVTTDRIPPPKGTRDTYGAMGVTTGATHHLRADNVSPVEVAFINGVVPNSADVSHATSHGPHVTPAQGAHVAPHGGNHLSPDGTHMVEGKPHGIKGLISKVTGH